jgi:hemerythrin-like domain-containing protein
MIQIGQTHANIAEPIEHLMAGHRRIEEGLALLARAADHLQENRTQALAAIAESITILETNGALHILDEEDSLFVRLWPYLSIEESNYLELLERQHDEMESVFAKLKEVVDLLPEAPEREAEYGRLADQLTCLYRSHVQSEDEILTELSRRLLSAEQLEAISEEMRNRRSGQD